MNEYKITLTEGTGTLKVPPLLVIDLAGPIRLPEGLDASERGCALLNKLGWEKCVLILDFTRSGKVDIPINHYPQLAADNQLFKQRSARIYLANMTHVTRIFINVFVNLFGQGVIKGDIRLDPALVAARNDLVLLSEKLTRIPPPPPPPVKEEESKAQASA